MSNIFGFFLSELRIKGSGRPDVVVPFGKGLSVVVGPSETGKSLICDAINYAFGASTPLRNVPESRGYGRILVEVEDYSGGVSTLERSWNGGDITIYNERALEITDNTPCDILAAKHDPNDPETISNALLQRSGLDGFVVRMNAKGKIRGLSFRDLKEYTVVTHERIITMHSPVHSGQYTERTVESSVFRLLLSGFDDSDVSSLPQDNSKLETKAQNELVEQFRQDVQNRIAQLGRSERELLQTASQLDALVMEQSKILDSYTTDTRELEIRRGEIWRNKQNLVSRHNNLEATLARFRLLSQKYDSDQERLLSNLETGSLLGQLSEDDCPLCGASPEHHKHDIQFDQNSLDDYVQACRIEIEKITQLQSDLSNTQHILMTESETTKAQISLVDIDLDAISISLKSIVEPNIASLRNGLSELVLSRREIDRSLSVYDEMRRLDQITSSLDGASGKSHAAKPQFPGLAPSDYEILALEVNKVLTSWSFPELTGVSFDPKTEDVIISGRPRSALGTGYRAITYAAFVIALLRLCRRQNLAHPGFVILDSPLITYRQPDEYIGKDLKPAFYRDLAAMADDVQIIVLEHEEPPVELEQSIHLTRFTKSRSYGRYGLLPI